MKKDDFIYSFKNREEFTLTSTELSNICSLLLNISREDNNNIDIDEIQMSYLAYLNYYELIEVRVVDLLDKMRLNIAKKVEGEEEIEDLVKQIEERASESKM